MSEFPFSEIDQEYAAARQELEVALSNPDYMRLAANKGILELSDVDSFWSGDVQAVVDIYGWPTLNEDGLMEPVHDFARPEDFLDSLCPDDEHGPRFLSSAPFIRLLQCYPIANMREATSMDGAMGIAPVVHRAYALAPDFFDPLRRVLNKLQYRYGVVSDYDHLYEELMRPVNTDVIDGIYMAYRLMGRLIKVHDISTSAELRHYKDEAAYQRVLLNADEALRRADVA